VSVVLGFNTQAEIFYADEFRKVGAEVIVATADGSQGIKGFVTDAIHQTGIDFDYFYACGSLPMLKALSEATDKPGELSLEERMGCGFGICMGCSIQTASGAKRVCKEGPVFKKEDVIW
jgi:dihydroorotate dehydrogenase electron transfer subunit